MVDIRNIHVILCVPRIFC